MPQATIYFKDDELTRLDEADGSRSGVVREALAEYWSGDDEDGGSE